MTAFPRILRAARTLTTRARQRFLPRRHRLLFAFSGGSGAWPGMGRELYRRRRVFRDAIDAAGAVVEEVLGWPAASLFRGEAQQDVATPELQRRNEIIHLGMVQIGQVELWRAEGVVPAGVVSVSLGEMVAPFAAGALSRDECARVLAVIAHAISRTRSNERMFILDADAVTAQRLCRNAPVPLDYLGNRSPRTSLVLGREHDTGVVRAFLDGLIARELRSDWNYHTPRLDVDRAWVKEQLRDLHLVRPFCPVFSAAAGGPIREAAFDADFFSWMVSRPLHFGDAVAAALANGYEAIVNIGAQPANTVEIGETAHARGATVHFIDTSQAHEELTTWKRAASAARSLRGPIGAPQPLAAATTAATLDPGDTNVFETYEELRRQGPVHLVAKHGVWIALDFDDVQSALAQPQRFSSRVPLLQQIDPTMLGNDPPDHTAVRRVIMRYFSGEATARRAELAERIAQRLLQPLLEHRELDVVRGFADPLADAIGADLLGIGPEVVAELVEPTLAAEGNTARLYAELHGPLVGGAHRAALFEELLRDADGAFDEPAARGLIRFLWVSATEEVRRSIPNAILLLLQHEDVRARIEAEPQLLAPFLEETLRLLPPEHMVARMTTEDVVLGGAAIPAGSVIYLCLAAANRDPAQFAEPSRLRLDRSSKPHLSFGGGAHRCIGAPLARVLMSVALRELFRIAPRFRAVQPLATIRCFRHAPFRKIQQLVIGT